MMIRAYALALGVTLGAAPALADTTETCRDDAASLDARVAACQAILADAPDQAVILAAIGRAYERNDKAAEALGWYDQALAVDATNRRALVGRVQALSDLDRFDDAEGPARDLVAAHPDWYWGHYRLGWILNQLDRHAEALAPLEASIALDPDYRWSWVGLGIALDETDNPEGGGRAWREATRLDPFDTRLHRRGWQAFRAAGMPDEAAYHARIGHTLDPNDLLMRDWLLNAYFGDVPVSELPPMAWTPPPHDRAIRYLAVQAPVDQRDDVDRAIEEMMTFFGGNSYPIPDTASVIRVSFDAVDDVWFRPTLQMEHRQNVPDIPEGAPSRYYTMFPFEFQPGGPDGPLVAAHFEDAEPSDLWPLAAGNMAAGSGRYVIDCTQGIGLRYVMLGCLPDIDDVEVGSFVWEASVDTDRIHVPLGTFDTYRLDISMTAQITMMSVTRELPYTASFWIAPEVNAWIARIFTVGDQYAFHQAMEIIPRDAP
jgi:tetratricopeptide (TPR) repeat protein